jgi:hypothetical protein
MGVRGPKFFYFLRIPHKIECEDQLKIAAGFAPRRLSNENGKSRTRNASERKRSWLHNLP